MRTAVKAAVTKADEKADGRAGPSAQHVQASAESRKRGQHPRNPTSPVTKEAPNARAPVPAPAALSLHPRREGAEGREAERDPRYEHSVLNNVRHVWADEAAAAAGGISLGEEVASPRSSAFQQEAPSSDSWRPPLMISQTAPSPKTSTDGRFHCNRRDAFLVSFGFCLGVSGFWRFPALMAEHGASFLLACMVIYVLMAQPVFYLELAMGQFIGSGVTRLNKCFPLLNGVGYVTVWYCFLLASCHSLRVTYAVFFLLYGITESVPWSECRDSWSTDCFTPGTEFLRCKYVQMLGQPAANESEALVDPSAMYCINASRTPPEAYFTDYVLQRTSGIDEIGALRMELLVFMTVVWAIVLGVSSQTPHIVHAVNRALFWVAMLCFVPFMVESTYHHFTMRGLLVSLTPDLAVLTSSKVWLDAAEHSLFSLGTSSGLVFFLGSRCKYGSCFERCAAWTIVAEVTACDLIALTTCLWIYKPGNTEQEITPAVPFNFRQLVTTAQLVVSCVFPSICNALVFTSFVATGLTANVLLVKTCVTEIASVLNYATSGAYSWTLLVVCALAYACSVSFCTKGGLYIQNIFEQGLARNLFFIVSLLQVISLVWFYGVRRLSFDLEYMLKDPVGIYWLYCWAFTAPVILVLCAALYVSEGAGSASLTIGDYTYPPWVAVFVWVSSGVSLLPVPLMALVHWLRVDMDFSKALGTDPMWGPQDPDRSFDYNGRIRTFLTTAPMKEKGDAKDKGGLNRTPVLFTASSFTALKNGLPLE